MVSIVPFLPSFRWYAAWIEGVQNGLTEESAAVAANSSVGICGKDFARTVIADNGREQMLSVPIVGGSSILKRRQMIADARLSDHANWRHVHLGALEAAYGRMPFYQHLMPEIRECYSTDADSLAEFNILLHKAISSFLLPASPSPVGERSEIILERGSELLEKVSAERSMIETLFRFGPESILPLMEATQK